MPAASASPDDGLSETTLARYDVDGDGPVEVTVTTTLVNNKPDSGNYYYFWDSYGVPVPEGAEDVVATSRGATLPVSLERGEDPSVSLAVASFSALMYGQEREIVWTYTIPGDPIRSESYTRVGPGYATFTAVGSGDTGQVTIEIVTPTTMTFDSTWDGFTSSDDGDLRTHRSTESQDEYGTFAYVSVRDPEQADTSDVTVGETTLTLSSFPGDAEWSEFVTEQVTAGLPLLEETIGISWPGGVDTIREDVSPEVLGYAWFDPGRGQIVVPEDLDAALLMHELSHAWLNSIAFEGRWLYEGLSEFVGQRVAAQTAGDQSPDGAPDRDDPDAVALTAWDEVELTDGVDDAELYAYAASYTAMVALLGELDDEAVTDVISAAYEGESAYAGPDGDDVEPGRTDWQRFLDLVEGAGVTVADDVYRTWVLDPDQQELLDARSPARETYAAIDEADGGWLPPLGLRTAMTDWTFEDATTISAALGLEGTTLAADALASTAGAVQTAAEQAGLPEPASVRQSYEEADSADDYAALELLLPQAVGVVGNVGQASEAAADDGNPLGELGQLLLSVDDSAADSRESLAEGDLDAADAAAETTIDRAAIAPWLGGGVIVVLLAAVAGATLLIIRARRRPVPAVAGGAWVAPPVGWGTSGEAWPAQAPGTAGLGLPTTSGAGPMIQHPGGGTFPVGAPPAAAWPPGWPTPPGAATVPLTTPDGVADPQGGHVVPSAWTGRPDGSETGS
jgi:hypothetical protein